MDLVSVYRDAIAVAAGAPGALVNEEIRAATSSGWSRATTPEVNLRRIEAIFDGPRADAGVQRAGRLGTGVDDGGAARCPRGAVGEARDRRWSSCLALVLAGVRRCRRRDPATPRRRRPTPPAVRDADRRHLAPARQRAARARSSQPFYSQQLDWEACGSGNECATIEVPLDYDDPTGETIELALLKIPADGDARRARWWSTPAAPARPAPTTPRTPTSRSASRCATPSTSSASTRAAPAPAPPVDCLTDDELDDYIASRPGPGHPGRGQGATPAGSTTIGAGCVEPQR